MNYAMQLSASGALTAMYRQDVLSSNLANVNTVGYKPVIPEVRQRDAVRDEDGLQFLPSNRMLEQLGAGVHLQPNRIDFGQGPIETTGNAFDLAIDGDGFFRVADIENGEPVSRLTRDGRMTIGPTGELVLAASGQPVLNDTGERIPIDPAGGPVSIDASGVISQAGAQVARLDISDVRDRSVLTKIGESMFGLPRAAGDGVLIPGTGRVRQGAVEGSGVNEISALMGVSRASSAARRNLEMIQRFDQLMDGAINRLGRVG